MLKSNNVNITSSHRLPTPGEIRSELPLSLDGVQKVVKSRREVCEILDGRSSRRMVIVGPCSIHDPDAAYEYAEKLHALAGEVSDRLMVIMRVYFEKPRTTVGWKGLIYDPGINGEYNIERGLYVARKLLRRIVDLGLPTATEMLDTIIAQYIADAVSWAAIGARTTESQLHRQLASGLSMPVGFKNATDGSLQIALDAIQTARSKHSFIGVLEEDGKVGVFHTRGNSYGHIVLRGGDRPNYGEEHIVGLKVLLRKAGLPQAIVVDCSHANSNKDYRRQRIALADVFDQIAAGEEAIKGVMLESYLEPGKQDVAPGCKPLPNLSITDPCIGWEETEELIRKAYEKLK